MLKKAEFGFKHFENDPGMSFALLEEDKVTKRPVRRGRRRMVWGDGVASLCRWHVGCSPGDGCLASLTGSAAAGGRVCSAQSMPCQPGLPPRCIADVRDGRLCVAGLGWACWCAVCVPPWHPRCCAQHSMAQLVLLLPQVRRLIPNPTVKADFSALLAGQSPDRRKLAQVGGLSLHCEPRCAHAVRAVDPRVSQGSPPPSTAVTHTFPRHTPYMQRCT